MQRIHSILSSRRAGVEIIMKKKVNQGRGEEWEGGMVREFKKIFGMNKELSTYRLQISALSVQWAASCLLGTRTFQNLFFAGTWLEASSLLFVVNVLFGIFGRSYKCNDPPWVNVCLCDGPKIPETQRNRVIIGL